MQRSRFKGPQYWALNLSFLAVRSAFQLVLLFLSYLVKISMDRVSVICKLAMKWYLMRMRASWLRFFKVHMTLKTIFVYLKGHSKYKEMAFSFWIFFSLWRYWRFSIMQLLLRQHQWQNCCHGNSIKGVILFLLWWTFMARSFKNTALIFPKISFIQFLPLFSCSIMTSSLI